MVGISLHSWLQIKFERVSIDTNFSIFGYYAEFANRNTCLEQPLTLTNTEVVSVYYISQFLIGIQV